MKVDKCIKVGENIHCAICTLCISDADFHKWVAHSTATLHVFLCKGMCSTVANSRIEAWMYQHQFSGISTNAVHQYQLSSENIFTVPWFLFNLYFWTISKHISPNTFAKLALSKLNINLKRQWMCSEKLSLSPKNHHSNSHSDRFWFNQTETISLQMNQNYTFCMKFQNVSFQI